MKLPLPMLVAVAAMSVCAAFAHSSSRYSDCEEITVIHPRVPLGSNTPTDLYNEFRSDVEVLQLRIDEQNNFGASIVFGGNEDGFTLAIIFVGSPGSKREAFVKRIATYAKLRWFGIAPKTSLTFATSTEEKISDNIPPSHAKLILERSPGIPVSALRPFEGRLVAMPWINDWAKAYIFTDKHVSFIFRVHEGTSGLFVPPPYIIDSAEFSTSDGPQIRAIAEAVYKRLESAPEFRHHPATTYWHELKEELQRAGLQWRSPAELTSTHVWD